MCGNKRRDGGGRRVASKRRVVDASILESKDVDVGAGVGDVEGIMIGERCEAKHGKGKGNKYREWAIMESNEAKVVVQRGDATDAERGW